MPPLAPTTPALSGCVSARLPWPLTVVHTGALSEVASVSSSPQAPEITTPPQMISGARASVRRRAARSTSSGSGA
jgi:hypothetical protein